MKNEICEKEGHQFRILKWWSEKEKNDWQVLMVCLKCGKTIVKKAKKENEEE
ncbi:MAG: hypothetical protein QW228_05690 [Candidatus Aenigmatarchaeota archaeon]